MKLWANQIVGIYQISCLKHTYIGQSINVTKRWNDHLRDLRNNSHHSSHFQNVYNKYGVKSLTFTVLQIFDNSWCEKFEGSQITKLLTRVEQVWMNLLNPDLNIKPAENSCSGYIQSEIEILKRCKKFKFWSPEGIIFEGYNLAEFARQQNLSSPALTVLLSGNQLHHKGWTCSEAAHVLYKIHHPFRGLLFSKSKNRWMVRIQENGKRREFSYKEKEEALKQREFLEKQGHEFKIGISDWKEKLQNLNEAEVVQLIKDVLQDVPQKVILCI